MNSNRTVPLVEALPWKSRPLRPVEELLEELELPDEAVEPPPAVLAPVAGVLAVLG